MNDLLSEAWLVAVGLSEEIDGETTSAATTVVDSQVVRLLGRLPPTGQDVVTRSADLLLARRATSLEAGAWQAMIAGARRGVENLRWRRRSDGAEAVIEMHSRLAELKAEEAEQDEFRAVAARNLDDFLARVSDGTINAERVDAEQVADWIHDAGIGHDVAQAGLRTAMEQSKESDRELVLLGSVNEWQPVLNAIGSALRRRCERNGFAD